MKICIPFKPGNSGGPSTFYHKFAREVEARGHDIVRFPTADTDVVLSIIYAAPRALLQSKKLGLPIVQRLDGVYQPSVYKDWRKRNFPIWVNYRFFSNRILFQSHYSAVTAQLYLGETKRPYAVVHNGVSLDNFFPGGHDDKRPQEHIGLALLSTFLRESEILPIINVFKTLYAAGKMKKLIIVGKLAPSISDFPNLYAHPAIEWRGRVPFDTLPNVYREASILLSSKLGNNCPNIVLEALASGVPVACYDSGAHRELVDPSAGLCVPTGDVSGPNPELDTDALADAAAYILDKHSKFSEAARHQAETRFGVNLMVDRYLEVLSDAIEHHRVER